MDTVLVFDKGEIVASGKFSELAATSEFAAKFVNLSSQEITD